MQTSKSFVVICAAAFCAALLPLRAADTDAQLKAREALEKKLQEMEPQPAAATAPPSVTAPKPKQQAAPPTFSAPVIAPAPAPTQAQQAPAVTAPAPKAAPAPAWRATPPGQFTPSPTPAMRPRPAAAPPAPAANPSGPVLIAAPAVDAASIAKAREALHQKMAELEGQPAPGTKETVAVVPPAPKAPAPVAAPPPAVAPAPAPAPKPAPAAVVVTPPPPVQPVPPAPQPMPVPTPAVQASGLPVLQAPPPSSEENIAKARAAMEQRLKQLEGQPTAQAAPAGMAVAPALQAPAAKPVPRPPKPAHTLQPFSPLPAPPAAISSDKQQRLDELLRKYMADQLTPEEYHQQRAKIVNEH